ncbi:hypothetical protein Pint_04895 [Pistacia integerrima]|uniref:Uncharacterized protein n=1 Tax=Pistacia integerrima TaxID=434235 RepID=A0ACC0Z4L4_9ROSI|nr:hypothetical protein Pint_04895 [Pistacia integerrima]
MSHEIVPADPIDDDDSYNHNRVYMQHGGESSTMASSLTRSLTSGREHVPEPFDSERLPPTLASEIQRFLRVANLIETEEPRIAYLCRFHAFEIAHNMDRNSTGRGVRQFKTSLLQRLELDEETTINRRKTKSDIRELKRVYHIYKDYILKNGGALDLKDREKLINARRIASVLYEVLRTVANAAGHQALADRDNNQRNSQLYVPCNILPLDHGVIQHVILQFTEVWSMFFKIFPYRQVSTTRYVRLRYQILISGKMKDRFLVFKPCTYFVQIKAAIAAVRNTRGLPSAQYFQKSGDFVDLFEFLQYRFGFQEGNVANQREHLILLLANLHVRHSEKQSSNKMVL